MSGNRRATRNSPTSGVAPPIAMTSREPETSARPTPTSHKTKQNTGASTAQCRPPTNTIRRREMAKQAAAARITGRARDSRWNVVMARPGTPA